MDQEKIAKSFTAAFNKAQASYDDDKLEDCVAECEKILEEPECPRYHHIKTLVLLGICLEDIGEVGECYREALRLWKLAKAYHEEQDVQANAALAELKEGIDSLCQVIVDETNQDVDWSEMVEDGKDVLGEEATIDQGAVDDPKALLAADKTAPEEEVSKEKKPETPKFGDRLNLCERMKETRLGETQTPSAAPPPPRPPASSR